MQLFAPVVPLRVGEGGGLPARLLVWEACMGIRRMKKSYTFIRF